MLQIFQTLFQKPAGDVSKPRFGTREKLIEHVLTSIVELNCSPTIPVNLCCADLYRNRRNPAHLETLTTEIAGQHNRSCRDQLLNNLDRKQTLTLEELNERLWAWLDVYHRTEHSSLGTTPLLRWQRDIEHIRQLPPATDFRRLFFHRLDRVVRRDCTFLLHSHYYEAPPHLVGETIEARFDPLDPALVEIYFQGQMQGVARLVDPVVNAQLPSTKSSKAQAEPTGINFVDLLIKKKDEEEPPW